MSKFTEWAKEKCDKAEEGLKNFGANFTKFVDEHPRLITTTIVGFFVGLPIVLGLALPPSEEDKKELSGSNEEEDKSNMEQIWDFVQGLELAPGESFDIQINSDGTGVTHNYNAVPAAENQNVVVLEEPAKTYDVAV